MFKKLTFFLFFVIAFVSLEAQVQPDTLPPYKKDNHMPAFRIQKFDETWLLETNLPKNVPTVIIYFSPDCAHCKHEAREIVKNIDKLKNVNFVWISYKEMELIKEFSMFWICINTQTCTQEGIPSIWYPLFTGLSSRLL